MKPEVWGYICFKCANDHGAVWPIGHVATCCRKECLICNEQKSVCHMHNWHWPDIKESITTEEDEL